MDQDGKVQFVSAFQDISERQRLDEELRRYAHIVSNASDMLVLLDKDYVFLAANKAYLSAFRQTADQVIGRTVAEVLGEDIFDKVIRPSAERCLAGIEIH